MRIDGTERVVQQVHVRILIHRAGHRDALLLPAAQRDAAVADLRQVAVGQDLEIGAELRGAQGTAVPVGGGWGGRRGE